MCSMLGWHRETQSTWTETPVMVQRQKYGALLCKTDHTTWFKFTFCRKGGTNYGPLNNYYFILLLNAPIDCLLLILWSDICQAVSEIMGHLQFANCYSPLYR